MIKISNAHIGHDKVLVEIKQLTLEKGFVHILAGRNGSGKSTLLKTLTGQLPLLDGTIEVDGKDITTLHDKDISQKISFVRSTFPHVDFLKCFDYIALGRSPYTNALGRLTKHDKAIVQDAIDTLQLNHLQDKFTTELSDGERQLISIARAIAQETDIIFLDEPTAFLDYSNKIKVLDQLKRIAEDLDKCIILSSHDIDLSIEANCPFLVLQKQTKTLTILSPPIKKEELLSVAFGDRD